MEYASEELRNDKEVVLAAVEQDGYALKYASEELQNDKDIVLAAVKQNGYFLKYASEELKNDKEFLAGIDRADREEKGMDITELIAKTKEAKGVARDAAYEPKDLGNGEKEINIADLADVIGVEDKQIQTRDGSTRTVKNWEPEQLKSVQKEISPLSGEKSTYIVNGAAPAWLAATISHALHPQEVMLYDPKIGDISLNKGMDKGEELDGQPVEFTYAEYGDDIAVISGEIRTEDGLVEPADLEKMRLPEIPANKHLIVDGRMPNWMSVSIAESYAHVTKSVSFNQPQVGFTTAISHSKAMPVGSFSKDLDEMKASIDEYKKEKSISHEEKKETI